MNHLQQPTHSSPAHCNPQRPAHQDLLEIYAVIIAELVARGFNARPRRFSRAGG